VTRNSHIFETKIPNGPLGDPVVYCLSQKTGEALLLDLGDLSNLSNKEILKVRHVAVSHTHLDHFIGFDRLLRVNVPHFKPFELCGPPGLIKNVQGKMNAYCWNLLEPGQIRIRVRKSPAMAQSRPRCSRMTNRLSRKSNRTRNRCFHRTIHHHPQNPRFAR